LTIATGIPLGNIARLFVSSIPSATTIADTF
jgi:hypothetical protein